MHTQHHSLNICFFVTQIMLTSTSHRNVRSFPTLRDTLRRSSSNYTLASIMQFDAPENVQKARQKTNTMQFVDSRSLPTDKQ